MRGWIVLVWMAAAAGCSNPESDPADECGPNGECPSGFVCMPSTNRCIRSGGAADAGIDARPGADAGGAADARPMSDASPPVDAAPGAIETFLDTKPTDPTRETTASFTFSSGTAGATFECAMGKPYAFAACTSPKVYTNLADRRHEFAVRARTAAGALDATPAEHAFTVDTMGPPVTLVGPAEGSTSGRAVTFTFTAEAGASFSCAIDSTTLLNCAGGMKSYTLLAGGAHVFRIRATDAAGNGGATITRSWTVDAVGPIVSFDELPGDESGKNGTITFDANETATFMCRLDTGSFGACSSSAGYTFSDLSAGTHTLTVRATDAHGNQGADASYSWIVTGPVTVLVTHHDVPVVRAYVVFHDTLGAVLDTQITAGDGLVAGNIPPGGMVTAAYIMNNVHYLYTVTGVQPFEDVHVGRHPFLDDFTLQVTTTFTAEVPGAALYRQDFGDGVAWSSFDFPSGAIRPVTERQFDSSGDMNQLVSVTNDNGAIIGYAWVPGFAVPPGTPTVSQFLQPTTRTITISGVPAGTRQLAADWGIMHQGLGYRDGGYFAAESPDRSEVLNVAAPPSQVGQASWVNARVDREPGQQKIVTTSSSVNLGDALPFVTGLSLDRSVEARPRAQWTGQPAADGMVTVLQWGSGPPDPDGSHQWHLVTPSVQSVQAPALPDALASFRPRSANTIVILRHTTIESTAFTGPGFRSSWVRLAREGLIFVNQRTPPMFGTSFTTRMTLTRP